MPPLPSCVCIYPHTAQVKSQQRVLRSANRELDHDRHQLDRQEKQLESEIKKAAKRGDKKTAGVYAKQLVRLRQQKAKSLGLSAQITATGHQMTVGVCVIVSQAPPFLCTKGVACETIYMDVVYVCVCVCVGGECIIYSGEVCVCVSQTMQSQAKMAAAMGSTASAMAATNKQLKVEDIQRTMAGFEKESTKMELAGELSECQSVCV